MNPASDPQAADAHSFEAMRHAMVASQLRTTAVSDVRVVEAMACVPRERFVPAGSRTLAYRDTALPLPGGRTMNAPMATGRLLTEARIAPLDLVLLIGAAGGYSAAVLALLAAEVTAVEQDAELVAAARVALAGMPNVTLVEAPLVKGCGDGAPYDVLVIDGAVEHVPGTLLEQLKPGARIATGLVERGVTRLARGARTENGCGLVAFADAEAALLPGFAEPPRFTF